MTILVFKLSISYKNKDICINHILVLIQTMIIFVLQKYTCNEDTFEIILFNITYII